jgi:hypothetical protein
MRSFALPPIVLAALSVVVSNVPAQAQDEPVSWVASNGKHTHGCRRFDLCLTFGRAYDETVPGGEIRCVDSGDFGRAYVRTLPER